MCRNKIAFIIFLIPAFLFLQGCQDNIILPETVNTLPASRLLYQPKGTPCIGIPTVDYSGKTYHTVQIGRQCWLKENLDVGIMIQGRDTSKDNGIIEKYCFNDSIENCDKYGGLFHWNEAMQYTTTAGTRGICPSGWHIPTFAEFQTLNNTAGVDGNALKAIGQGTGAGAGTNTSGFTALFVGVRNPDGSFEFGSLGYTNFWSSTGWDNTPGALFMALRYNDSRIYLTEGVAYYKEVGLSVRCIKD